MGARSILATLVSLLLIYVPIAPAASPAVVGKVMTKGQALVNGTLVPAEATVFAGDRLSTEKDTASGISLPGGDQVFLPAVSAAQFNSVGRQITVALERGALAVVNRSPQPVIVEANGVHIQGGSAISVYEVAIAGNTLKVMARKGMATVKASNRTVEVKEGTTLDASTPPAPVGTGGLGPLWTVVLVTSAAAGITGLVLGIQALNRPQPQNCTIVSPNTITCP